MFRPRLARARRRARLTTARVGTGTLFSPHDAARNTHARRRAFARPRSPSDRISVGAPVEVVTHARQHRENRTAQPSLARVDDSTRRLAGPCHRSLGLAHPFTL